MSTLTLIFNNRLIPFDVKGESTAPSEKTNKELIKLAIGIKAENEASHAIIQELIDEGRRESIEGTYTKDSVRRRWKIIHSSFVSDPLETYFNHTIVLIEMEGG